MNGGDEGDRTPGLGIANAALSQLSYVPYFQVQLNTTSLMSKVNKTAGMKKQAYETANIISNHRKHEFYLSLCVHPIVKTDCNSLFM